MEVFQLALNNLFLVNRNKVFPSLVTTSPSITKLKTISNGHLAWIAIQIFPLLFTGMKTPHICQALFKHKRLWLSALGDEKFSSSFNFVGASCNGGGGHHISVPHIGDTQGTFSRQLLKLLVVFMVWEAFFFFFFFLSAFHVSWTKDQN